MNPINNFLLVVHIIFKTDQCIDRIESWSDENNDRIVANHDVLKKENLIILIKFFIEYKDIVE